MVVLQWFWILIGGNACGAVNAVYRSGLDSYVDENQKSRVEEIVKEYGCGVEWVAHYGDSNE